MALFKEKKIGATDTLGERLRRVREEAGLTLENLAGRTGISIKHLTAIEEGRYGDLPGEVYARNFVRQYAKILQVSEETAIGMFEHEHTVAINLAPAPIPDPAKPVRIRAYITPQGIRWAAVLLLGIAILVYLGLELRNFTSPPSLIIDSPPAQYTTESHSVEIRGMTDPEVTVMVNGRAILVDYQGRFQELIDLQDGLNTIVITAQNKRGRTTTEVRQILVEPSS
ncbi:MAG: helix-turn-helix domain-containing protein [Candidatus Kerfeldbacteria bacterium]